MTIIDHHIAVLLAHVHEGHPGRCTATENARAGEIMRNTFCRMAFDPLAVSQCQPGPSGKQG